jgi:Skp family chaperone for outer membrane proteins
VLSTVVLGSVLTVSATAKPGVPAGDTYAIVDLEKVSNEFTGRQKFEKEILALQETFNLRLKRRADMPLLPEADQAKLDELSEKDPNQQTPADKAKITELTKKGLDESSRIDTLRNTPSINLTDANKESLKTAEKTVKDAQAIFDKMRGDLDAKLQSGKTANIEKLRDQVKAAIAKIAQQKNITLVFNNETVLFAGNDITKPVLDELNKK